jgi:hypothetical protein
LIGRFSFFDRFALTDQRLVNFEITTQVGVSPGKVETNLSILLNMVGDNCRFGVWRDIMAWK